MLFHPGPVWDSVNSKRWEIILLLSSTHVSMQPLSHSERSAGLESVRTEVLNFSPLVLPLLPSTLSLLVSFSR